MLNTYINFKGDCREAFEFYRSVFGGEFAILETFRNGPPDMSIPEDEMDNIMHVSFPIGDSVLMGSDTAANGFGKTSHVSWHQHSLSASVPRAREEADRLFSRPVRGWFGSPCLCRDMFWGSYFGCIARIGSA